MHTEATPTAVVLAGAGVEAERWGSAFRGVEGVSVDRIDSASDDDLLEVLARPAVDAVAFVMPVADLAGAVKRSLMARRHVFVAGGVALAPIPRPARKKVQDFLENPGQKLDHI